VGYFERKNKNKTGEEYKIKFIDLPSKQINIYKDGEPKYTWHNFSKRGDMHLIFNDIT